jgi:hypothetical protein
VNRPAEGIAPVEDRSAWHSTDFSGRASLGAALEPEDARGNPRRHHCGGACGARGHHPRRVSLASCKALLNEVSAELDQGLGFAVIAGFPVDDYSPDDALRAFLRHLHHTSATSSSRPPSAKRIIHVTDKGKPYSGNSRGYHSKSMLPFHSDGAYLAGLLCLETAHQGRREPARQLDQHYNEIARRFPERIAALAGLHPRPPRRPCSRRKPGVPRADPVFGFYKGLLHCCYNRNGIVWAQDKSGEKLTADEIAALDAVDRDRRDPAISRIDGHEEGRHAVRQQLRDPALAHRVRRSRRRRRRHLVRLWLDCPDGRRRGPTLLDLYTSSERRFKKYEAPDRR